ncbi:MAG: hypothetical protein ETSY2_34355 [Candidatus Entotheonella gemina]|uniref:Uncharacterized protein n=1 Tax=Candidatus Entotheonella gemina TaxID=1429439 RepID=W4LY17_9BACT|nr:MAG: hypothetical protein ETSY2_34355 [Candidatus Entotheonella gemina]
MYMMRLVYHCKRGKSLEIVECLKALNELYTSDGCKNGRIYIDRMGLMDRAIYDFELESIDRFYSVLKDRYAALSPEAQQIVDRLNDYAEEGYRELYEVIV